MHRRVGTAAGLPVVVAVAVLLSACGDASGDVGVAKTAFCEDLVAFRTRVDEIAVQASLSAPSTLAVEDVKNARDDVADAFDDVRASASQVQAAIVDTLQSAFDDLNGAVENLGDDTTLQEAQTELAARKAAFLTAWQQVAGLVDCPAA